MATPPPGHGLPHGHGLPGHGLPVGSNPGGGGIRGALSKAGYPPPHGTPQSGRAGSKGGTPGGRSTPGGGGGGLLGTPPPGHGIPHGINHNAPIPPRKSPRTNN